MNAKFLLLPILLFALVAGCGDAETRTVTEGADQQSIADYEAALANATGEGSYDDDEEE